MLGRTAICTVLFLPLISAFSLQHLTRALETDPDPATSSGGDKRRCKCLFNQPCWPSEASFTTLASELSQPLLKPLLPPAAPCYDPELGPTSPECLDAQSNERNPIWRSNHPGAQQNINFEKYIFANNSTLDACYTNTTLSPADAQCGQGSVPPIGVNATRIEDVQAAVKFANKFGLKVVVKTTGHDYMGRSAGRGGFLIWTHHMKERTFEESFVPAAITVGSGVQWSEAYELAGQNGRYVVGGLSPNGTVGAAGGWIQGGGHSVFAPRHGLGVDNVLEFNLVLADGSYVTANAYTRPDLFWALRGGGGGTFGILTSVTYQTHPSFPFTLSFVSTSFPPAANTTDPNTSTNSSSAALKSVTELIKLQPLLSDKSWGANSWFNKDFLITISYAPETSVEETNTTLAPFVQSIRDAIGGDEDGTKVTYLAIPFESWDAFLRAGSAGGGNPGAGVGPGEPANAGNNVELASRLLPKKITEDDPEKVARVFLETNNVVGFNSVAGGAVSRADPNSMALHPGWRKAVTHAWVAANWNDGDDVATINEVIEQLKQEIAIIDQLTTDSASYLNEGSRHEVDFKKAYWGPNYSRLSQIKRKYDPSSLFIVTSGVGSENWDRDQVCRIA